MIHRADLVGALAEFLPAGTARCGFECVGLEQRGERVAVRFANGHTDEADAVVGADGIKSVVRAALFRPEDSRYSGYACWRGICPRPASVEPGYAAEWWGCGRRIGIVILPGDRVYWWAAFNAPAGSRPADQKAAVIDAYRGWSDPVPELLASTPAERLVHNDVIDRPPATTWSKWGVGLIGDAAHPTTPNLGQGGCMAIEDSVFLARAMARHPDPKQAFEAVHLRALQAVGGHHQRIMEIREDRALGGEAGVSSP